MDIQDCLTQYREKITHFEKDTKAIFDEIKKEAENVKVEYWRTQKETSVCFILSCPGRLELISDKLCAGTTGDNLDKLLGFLNLKAKNIFPYQSRYDYHLANASKQVHYKELTDDSTPKCKEIKKYSNDLKQFIKNNGIKICICCGNDARKSIEYIESELTDVTIVNICHIGSLGLHATYPNKTNEELDDETRLQYLAEEIIEQYSEKKESLK